MKFKLPISVCILISVTLVVCGLAFGTVSGFRDDRQEVSALLMGENGLLDVLSYRGADGLNLCVVARRHLAQEDADVLALEAAARKLMSQGESLATKRTEDERLTAAAAAVAQKLAQTESFTADERDRNYLDMLSSDLKNLSVADMANTYDQAAAGFNAQLTDTLWGRLAAGLGVAPCELYR